MCLARTRDNGEPLATLGAATFQRRTTILRTHTCTEAVHLRPLPLLRLICSFGHKSKPSIENWLNIVKDLPFLGRLDLLV